MKLKTLDVALMREMSAPFFIGIGAFLMILCFNMAYFAIDLVVNKNTPIIEVVRLILLRIPILLTMALPVAALLATSLAFNRITRDRELNALKLAGIPTWRLIVPFLVVGLILSVISFTSQEWAAPRATHESDVIFRRLQVESNVPSITPDTFFRSSDRVFYFHEVYRTNKRELTMKHVMMFRLTGAPFPEIWSADEAVAHGDHWVLKNVSIHRLDKHGRSLVDASAPTAPVDLRRDIDLFLSAPALPEELTAAEMRARIREYNRMGVVGMAASEVRYDYYSKFALPLACLVCCIIGIPLNMRYARLGGFFGFFLALVAVFVYYNGMLFARSLSYSGTMPPMLGAWLPDIVLGIACALFLWREM